MYFLFINLFHMLKSGTGIIMIFSVPVQFGSRKNKNYLSDSYKNENSGFGFNSGSKNSKKIERKLNT